MPALLGNQILLPLAIGLPIVAVVTTLALGQKLRSKPQHHREAKTLYVALAVLTAAVAAMSMPLNPFFFGGLQFGLMLMSIPVFVFLVWQLFYYFRCGIESGLALAALVSWVLAIAFWCYFFLF
jgi:hypothetical protein